MVQTIKHQTTYITIELFTLLEDHYFHERLEQYQNPFTV